MVTRRQFLVGAGAVASLYGVRKLLKTLDLPFFESSEGMFLLWEVKKGDNLALIARYFTGNESRYKALLKVNNKTSERVRVGEKIRVPIFDSSTAKLFISQVLLTSLGLPSRAIEVWTIEVEEGSDSVAKLVETFLEYQQWGYNETLGTLLYLNSLPLNGAIPDYANLRVPTFLVREDVRRDRPMWNPLSRFFRRKVEYKEVSEDTRCQNPFRAEHNVVLARLRDTDLYLARRIRTINGKDYVKVQGHQGLDLSCNVGTPLYSIADATVKLVARHEKPDPKWRYGLVVVCQTLDGYTVEYVHLSKVFVREGQQVTKQTRLGLSGVSGNASPDNPHVHVEIRDRSGNRVNPAGVIFGQDLIAVAQL